MIKGIIFYLDDVITDTAPEIEAAHDAGMKAIGIGFEEI